MMMKIATFALFALLLSALTASAQETLTFPGSMWTVTGNTSPAEKGNIVSLTHAEQGIAKRGFELFSETTIGTDSDGHDWNRKSLFGVGGRYTLRLGTGMVRVKYA